MKKLLLSTLIIFSLFLTGCIKQMSPSTTKIAPKYYCQTDTDCTLSETDPNGYGICVNNDWYEEWKKNPKSEKTFWECFSMGKETCTCINNACQRTDSEPSC